MKKITPILTDREYLADVFARARAGMDTLTDEQCAALASGLRAFLASAKPVPMSPKELSLFVASAFAEHGGKLAASICPSLGETPFRPCAQTLGRLLIGAPPAFSSHVLETENDAHHTKGWNDCRADFIALIERMMQEAR